MKSLAHESRYQKRKSLERSEQNAGDVHRLGLLGTDPHVTLKLRLRETGVLFEMTCLTAIRASGRDALRIHPEAAFL